MQKKTDYDYIICGGGMSGLSLAYHLIQSNLNDKRILIIEPEEKNQNDRTWAFWEIGTNPFESILYKKWDSVNFYNTEGKKQHLDIGEYNYKVLRGIDFYRFTTEALIKNGNVTWEKDFVESITDNYEHATVKTKKGKIITCGYVFDSTFKLNLTSLGNNNLLQHFKGVVVQTNKPFFNSEIPDMMNFGVEQKNNECRFIYILPFSEKKALIEYTLFSESLLTPEEYDETLNDYIKKDLKLTNYEILEQEFGVIPMSDVPTQEFPSKRITRIGTSGGYTNPATGYTFQNTQERLQKMVFQLEKTGTPISKMSWWQKRHLLYASILLNVIKKKRYPIGKVFAMMFEKNKPETMFKFLDGKTNFIEELKLMYSTPLNHFIYAAIEEIASSILKKGDIKSSKTKHLYR